MHATLVVTRIAAGAALALAALAVVAQNGPLTTEQIGKDPSAIRQDAERQQAQDRAQQQQQQRSQQAADQQWNDTTQRIQQQRAASDQAQHEAVRRMWQQRPPLAPEHNPLLGRWESLGAGQRKAAAGLPPEMAQLANAIIGNVVSGVCDSMFGRGTVEFRPQGAVAIGRDGHERPMYRAEYRGGGSRVVVLPQAAAVMYMIIDFDRADHATVETVGCALARSGGAAVAKAASVETSLAAGGGAPQWTHVASSPKNGGMDMYVSIASIRRAGDKTRMLDLIDFKTRQSFEGKPFLSARNELEFDCATPRQRMLGSTGFSGHMGAGTVVASSEIDGPWQAVGSSGPGFDHWQTACKRR